MNRIDSTEESKDNQNAAKHSSDIVKRRMNHCITAHGLWLMAHINVTEHRNK